MKACSVWSPAPFASMPLRVGDDYNNDEKALPVQSAVRSGTLQDVRLEASGNVAGGGG